MTRECLTAKALGATLRSAEDVAARLIRFAGCKRIDLIVRVV